MSTASVVRYLCVPVVGDICVGVCVCVLFFVKNVDPSVCLLMCVFDIIREQQLGLFIWKALQEPIKPYVL